MTTIQRLLGHNLLVEPIIETQTVGGIFIPGDAQQKRADRARVKRVGPDVAKKAGFQLVPGDVVVIEDFIGTGTPVDLDGVRHLIIDSDEVLAVLA